ncbi:MAG: DNA-formamidopyrimidine glycosylase family protein [Planctomycetota bacterium]|nr:DNA-formamidopyrimidine glycosylase family protein [Planctomycetota bacterium]
MPEGDTIYRTATVLRRALLEQTINAVESQAIESGQLVGCTITRVEPRGKHLLIHLNSGAVLHSHMGMTGSWHLYHHGQPWQKPTRLAALRLDTEPIVAVCFTPKTLEMISRDGLRRHRWLRQLGPDLLDPGFDVEEAIRRLRAHDARPLGEAVMDQSIVCGIGNIYKSEGLFVARLSPFDRVESCSDTDLNQLLTRTQRLMLRNRHGSKRRTRLGPDGASKWVYGRSGKPCLECGELIHMRRQSELGRSTYWCPQCQPSRRPAR